MRVSGDTFFTDSFVVRNPLVSLAGIGRFEMELIFEDWQSLTVLVRFVDVGRLMVCCKGSVGGFVAGMLFLLRLFELFLLCFESCPFSFAIYLRLAVEYTLKKERCRKLCESLTCSANKTSNLPIVDIIILLGH